MRLRTQVRSGKVVLTGELSGEVMLTSEVMRLWTQGRSCTQVMSGITHHLHGSTWQQPHSYSHTCSHTHTHAHTQSHT